MDCAGILAAPAGQPTRHSGDFPGSTDFVGRQKELEELKSALENAITGHGRPVMLMGEPGIGKTRTAQEVTNYAQARGVQVFWGRCYDGEGAPPYWPWIQPLRSRILRSDPEQIRSELGPGAAVIAGIVTDLHHILPDLHTPQTLDPDQARFRLFDSITTFLKNAAKRQPLMLVLDDLHWADHSSLLLLEFIAQELQSTPLLIIGTYRDSEVSRQHPMSRTLGSLIRISGFARLHLRGFSQMEVAHLVETNPGMDSSTEIIRAIHQRTEGNPLFVTEILRGLNQEVPPDRKKYLTVIPQGVKDAIAGRLSRLSERCNRVLTTGSLIRREFEFELLGGLVDDSTEEQLLEAVEEALTARIIEEVPGSPTTYQFSHALIQNVLAGELSATRRARLHGRIGDALEKLYEPERDFHAGELAYHYSESATVTGPEKLVHYSLLAGEQALSAYAWEEALQQFLLGLEAKKAEIKGTEPARDATEAALLFGLGRAQLATLLRGRMNEALISLDRAFEFYAEAGDVTNAVAVAEYPLPRGFREREKVERRVERGLTLVPHDSIAAGRILPTYGMELGRFENDYDKALAAFERALVIARRVGDAGLEMSTLAAWAQVDYFHLHLAECLEKSLRVIDLAHHANEPRLEVNGHLHALQTLIHLGDAKRADEHARAGLALAERLKARPWIFSMLRCSVNLYRFLGNWDQAKELALRYIAFEPEEVPVLKELASLEYELGEANQGDVHLEKMQEIMRRTTPLPGPEFADTSLVSHFVCRITGSTEHLEVAGQAAQVVLSSPLAHPFWIEIVRTGLALRAVQTGDSDLAQEQYLALAELQGKMRGSYISADRLMGLLANTMGNRETAILHFEDALAFCRKEGFRPELAWSCYDYAEALLQSNQVTDRGRPASLLEESLEISSKLGMRPLLERAVALQERFQLHPPKGASPIVPAYPSGLTHREVEVLRMVASGKSNAEIAAELVLSLRTVERHISNIYSKVNTHSRAEATAFAFVHGLIPTSRPT